MHLEAFVSLSICQHYQYIQFFPESWQRRISLLIFFPVVDLTLRSVFVFKAVNLVFYSSQLSINLLGFPSVSRTVFWVISHNSDLSFAIYPCVSFARLRTGSATLSRVVTSRRTCSPNMSCRAGRDQPIHVK